MMEPMSKVCDFLFVQYIQLIFVSQFKQFLAMIGAVNNAGNQV